MSQFFCLLLLIGSLLLMSFLSSCSRPERIVEKIVPSQTPRIVLTLYHTPTPSLTAIPGASLVEIPFTPVPTPTPFTHILVKGDTLGGIALRYGVSIEDLLSANPGINAQFLRVGDPVIVPLLGEIAQEIPTLTPIPLRTDPPVCYPSGEGGAWCFMLVENDQSEAVENLMGWVGLDSGTEYSVITRPALTPLNLLMPGGAMPLMAYFEPPIPQEYRVEGQLLVSLPVNPSERRYLSAEAADLVVEIEPEGKLALLRGRILLPDDGLPVKTLWLAAVGYGQAGEIAGVRKWEVEKECFVEIEAGSEPEDDAAGELHIDPACLLFEFQVYSLGPSIERVELLLEARP
jgi:LysM repeat protein